MSEARIAAGVEYDGGGFFGWQRQRQSPTVQECLEQALSKVADQPIEVVCSGRTDTGVHARCQVVHFDTCARRSERSWVLGANTHLPQGITLLWTRPVDDDFHARYSARRRHYRYRIINRWVRPAIGRDQLAWVRKPLDALAMHRAAQALIGEHDFSSFRAVGCQSKSPRRRVESVAVCRLDQEVRIDISANAFLYHMVRNIAGSLIAVGCGERDPAWVAEVLEARDRTVAGITAPAAGLCLLGPEYPDFPGLPIDQPVAFPATTDSQ